MLEKSGPSGFFPLEGLTGPRSPTPAVTGGRRLSASTSAPPVNSQAAAGAGHAPGKNPRPGAIRNAF
jgi:hypothetical protein